MEAKQYAYRLLLLLIGSLFLSMPTPLLAQSDLDAVPSDAAFQQHLTITKNGHLTSEGRTLKSAKLDILPDAYVVRYKLIDQPNQFLPVLVATIELPPTVTTAEAKARVIAVHGVEQYDIQSLDSQTFQVTATNIDTTATITVTVDLPLAALELSLLDQLIATIRRLTLNQWLAITALMPASLLIYAGILIANRRRDLFLSPLSTEVVQPPTNLPPAMVGALISGYVGTKEIAATLIDLARRGYIDIIYKSEQEFGFSQRKQWRNDPQLLAFERAWLEQIFSNPVISDVKAVDQQLNEKIWSDSVSKGIEMIYEEMVRLGYFAVNPQESHRSVRVVGLSLFFISILGLAASLLVFRDTPTVVLPWVVNLLISPSVIRLSLLVPHRTPAGLDQAMRWATFQRYLSKPEAMQYADQASLYDQYLAYAVALGVEGQWTARFSQLSCRLPEWFFTQSMLIDTYAELSTLLFSIVGFIGQKFSLSRKPSVI